MTIAQLAERLEALEKVVQRLEGKLSRPSDPMRPWWLEDAGRFKDDPVFRRNRAPGPRIPRIVTTEKNESETC